MPANLIPPRLRRMLTWGAQATALLSLLLFLTVLSSNLIGVKGGHWNGGGLMLTDLSQHYAAGMLWKEGEQRSLYRDYKLGEWLTVWKQHQAHAEGDTVGVNHFNYVYCPLVAWISSGLTRFSFGTWARVWLVLCCAAYGLSAWLLAHNDAADLYRRPLPLLWLAGFPGFFLTLIPGQNTVLTLALLLAAAALLNKRREVLAGLVLSCAFYKPQIMPCIALFMLLCGCWRFSSALAAGSLLWLLPGLVLCGWKSHFYWMQSLQDMAAGRQFVKPGLNQSWCGFLQDLAPGSGTPLPGALAAVLSLLTLLGAVFLVRKKCRQPHWQPAWTLYVAFTVWLLASPYVGHYELLLGLPWWMVLLVRFDWDLRHGLLLAAFWIAGLFSIAGLCLHVSGTAPMLALWLGGSLAWVDVQKSREKRN